APCPGFFLVLPMLLAACSSHPGAQGEAAIGGADATVPVVMPNMSDDAGQNTTVADAGSAAGGDAAAKTVPWNTVNRQPPGWYATPAAAAIAANILYYQNADGGWPKNIDMTQRTAPRDRSTIDNAGTTTQMIFLAKIFNATMNATYKDAFLKGLDYLLAA